MKKLLILLLGAGLTTGPLLAQHASTVPVPAPLPTPARSQAVRPALPQERLAPPPPRTPYGATPTLLDVAVSDSSTTYLVFPGAVSLVDVGMLNNYLIKIEATSVFIRARSKKTPPTPVMVRYGNKYWMGRLVTVQRPVLMLYDFTKPGALTDGPTQRTRLTPAEQLGPDAIVSPVLRSSEGATPATAVNYDASDVVETNTAELQTGNGAVLPTTSNGIGPDNPVALDRSALAKERLHTRLRQLAQISPELHSVAAMENHLNFSLVNVRNDKQFSYLRFRIINHSSIDYQVDLASFALVENSGRRFLGKKRNEAKRPMMPVAGRANQRIAANSTGYLYYAVPLFAATNQGHVTVGMTELSGARSLALTIPSVVINKAPTF